MKEPKQVIVMRTDLGMPIGKMVAQGAHASLSIILNMMKEVKLEVFNSSPSGIKKDQSLSTFVRRRFDVERNGEIDRWLTGPFTKICLGIDSLENLEKLYEKALELDLPVSKIVDAGRTCFDGVPTFTCIGIGPADPDKIDLVTGHLELL